MHYKKLFLFTLLFIFSSLLITAQVNSQSPSPSSSSSPAPSGSPSPTIPPPPPPAPAPVNNPVTGWAWSSNIGWISFNSSNAGSGGGPHSVTISTSSASATAGAFSGYAWSSNIGWISFVNGDGAHPDPTMNLNTGLVSGWIRACAGTVNGNCTGGSRTDGWDGWIELSGTNHTSPNFSGYLGTSTQGVTFASSTGRFSGYAWGSDVVGWVDFNGVICGGCVVTPVVSTDLCPNLAGLQASIPSGMTLDSSGNCVVPTDLCPNLAGLQASIPSGMALDSSGNCVVPTNPSSQGELWIGSTYSVQKFKQVRKNQSVPVGWDIGTWTGCNAVKVSGPPLTDWTTGVDVNNLSTTTLPRLQPGDYTLKISCGTNQTNSIQILVTDPGTGEI